MVGRRQPNAVPAEDGRVVLGNDNYTLIAGGAPETLNPRCGGGQRSADSQALLGLVAEQEIPESMDEGFVHVGPNVAGWWSTPRLVSGFSADTCARLNGLHRSNPLNKADKAVQPSVSVLN